VSQDSFWPFVFPPSTSSVNSSWTRRKSKTKNQKVANYQRALTLLVSFLSSSSSSSDYLHAVIDSTLSGSAWYAW
jgi:hypothetical protein